VRKCGDTLRAEKMIYMGMGEKNKHRAIIISPYLFNHLCQLSRLLCESTGIDQENNILGLDKV
jgi:hypothetical protein